VLASEGLLLNKAQAQPVPTLAVLDNPAGQTVSGWVENFNFLTISNTTLVPLRITGTPPWSACAGGTVIAPGGACQIQYDSAWNAWVP
jgi:hypothetical protein